MIPLAKYKTTLTYQVDKPRDIIINHLTKTLKNYEFLGDRLHITMRPIFFDMNLGRGIINLTIIPSDQINVSTIQAEIIPTSITREGLYIIGFMLFLWASIAFIISFSFNSLFIVLGGWAILAVVVHMTQKLNQGKLENYVKELVSGLNYVRMNSIA